MMKKANILNQMGIQQWRLREPLKGHDEKTHDQEHASKETIESHNQISDEIHTEINTTNKAEFTEAEGSALSSASNIHQENAQTAESTQALPQQYDWSALIKLLNDKAHCSSCSTVTPILGEGNITADWMFVFDSPTKRDVENQQLLTGRVGQLFDSILMSLNLNRESIYLSSIFKCPPAESISSDVAQCAELLGHQIKLIEPKVVIAFGEFTAQAIIKANEGLEPLRNQANTIFNQSISVIPTYTLTQMLDSPPLKMKVWADLKKSLSIIER